MEVFVNSDIDEVKEDDLEESGMKINLREPLSKNVKVEEGVKMIGDY